MKKNDGGPAFPIAPVEGFPKWRGHKGISVRDYFAAQVIAQCSITVKVGDDEADPALVAAYAYRYAKTAYAIADAMIEERSK